MGRCNTCEDFNKEGLFCQLTYCKYNYNLKLDYTPNWLTKKNKEEQLKFRR